MLTGAAKMQLIARLRVTCGFRTDPGLKARILFSIPLKRYLYFLLFTDGSRNVDIETVV